MEILDDFDKLDHGIILTVFVILASFTLRESINAVYIEFLYIVLYSLLLIALFPMVKITEDIVYFEKQDNINPITLIVFAIVPVVSVYNPGVLSEVFGFTVAFIILITLIQRLSDVS